MTEPTTCAWSQDGLDCDTYETECGNTFQLIADTPAENGFKFCCYCGKPIEQILTTLEKDNSDE